MDPQYLLKDEVEFELACRGYTQPGLVSALKKILKNMLEAESSMEVSYELKSPPQSVNSPSAELDTCSKKISTITCYLSEIQEKPDKQLYKRLVSRLFHVVNRLNLAIPLDEIEKARRNALLDKTSILLEELEGKDDMQDGEEITPEMREALHNSIGEDSKKILNLIDEQTSEEKAGANSNVMQDMLPVDEIQPVRKHKLVPISQWGVHFSGDSKFSVNAFIERVQELKDARHATHDDLWQHAIDFFKGDALIWFRANREFVRDWNELVLLLKRTFQSPYYQEELLTEAKARTQGKNEPVLIFIAVMQNMFNRLPNKISETEKLMIIVKNLQPYYQRAVCRDTFTSISDLVNVMRIIERTKINCDKFQEPKSVVNALEPDLAYKSSTETVIDKKEVSLIKSTDNKPSSNMRCWNCRETGHLFRSCSVPKQRLFCYRCGRFGITLKDCTCKGNASGEGRKPAN
ncbi:uncharacterized protein LOC123876106 isoform X1 [Maniola jurtina]|uniref:uncharacterized protein LOC123876106 isoform X1 n=1 Tax=Maniola jurtina TaxID=191418 RepID=UPI001E68EC82|nr:uncharacterized protein LOC123876106 isoform X1 [Maniola jurtina]XP_045778199.1 uncharacterized protein LOC123876106 isoform X2 [Maniola jurtina]XP_045778200.1 uncharacterized protein LOC123876106 isoform X1 [Maniola jurtina]